MFFCPIALETTIRGKSVPGLGNTNKTNARHGKLTYRLIGNESNGKYDFASNMRTTETLQIRKFFDLIFRH
jgi:hypothetical protein